MADVSQDSGSVPVQIVTDVVQYLASQDKSITQIDSFIGKLGDTGSTDIGIESLKELAHEEFHRA